MIHQDTISLLRECDAGIKMGVASLEDMLPRAKDDALRSLLSTSKATHNELKSDILHALKRFGDDGKEPNPMAKGMSAIKSGMEMMIDPSDSTIADLITDGCNMGVKSLSKYLNQYAAADESAKDICKRLIQTEERLAHDLRGYL